MLPLTRSRNRARFFGTPFSPEALFAGVNGVFYDISDLPTLFTTSAGTTQCAMPGQGSAVSVGLMLDKSQNGVGTNGAYRYNLLTYTEQFENAYWVKTRSAITANATTAPDGTITADKLVEDTNSSTHLVSSGAASGSVFSVYAKAAERSWIALQQQTPGRFAYFDLTNGVVGTSSNATGSIQSVGNGWYRCTITVTSGSSSWDIFIATGNGTGSYTGNGTSGVFIWGAQLTSAADPNTYQRITDTWYSTMAGNHAIAFNNTTARPELRARVNLLVATATLSTQSVTTQATSYTLRFAGTGSITLSGTATGSYSAGTHTITCTAGTLTLTVSGTVTTADLRPANSGALLPAYQAVVDANTYDTSGFPLYLRFDGIDDSMYTPANLNLSGTDKVSVFAGVRKLSDAAVGMFAEFSPSLASAGTFNLAAPSANVSLGANFGPAVRGNGSIYGEDAGSNAAPITAVLTSAYDLAAADKIDFRINGSAASVVDNGANAGTGNFGSYQFYVGSRGNSTFWFQGQVYGLVIVGSAVSAGNISATEQWVAQRTGIVIP